MKDLLDPSTSYDELLRAAGIPTLREVDGAHFLNHRLWHHDEESGLVMPVPAGAAEESEVTVGSLVVSWGSVSATPTVGGNASGVGRLQLIGKTLLRRLVLRISGQWDQSVGAETQATEGNPALITEVRLDLDGQKRRIFPGAVLFETNRFVIGGTIAKTDPAPGIASGKVFSSTLIYDMGFMDMEDTFEVRGGRSVRVSPREDTYLDLSQYANVFLEVVVGPFNRYVSGNTQANMSMTINVHSLEIPGPRRLPQRHFELVKVQDVDMNVTGVDRRIPLIRTKTVTRGILLRVGALNGTPITTALTSLTNVGVDGRLNRGTTVVPKQKQPVALYTAQVGADRNGISLTAGYVWIDFASNRQWQGLLVGDAYSDLNLLFDSSAQAGHRMEIFQAIVTR